VPRRQHGKLTWRLKNTLFTRITSLGMTRSSSLPLDTFSSRSALAFDFDAVAAAAGGHSAGRMIACTMVMPGSTDTCSAVDLAVDVKFVRFGTNIESLPCSDWFAIDLLLSAMTADRSDSGRYCRPVGAQQINNAAAVSLAPPPAPAGQKIDFSIDGYRPGEPTSRALRPLTARLNHGDGHMGFLKKLPPEGPSRWLARPCGTVRRRAPLRPAPRVPCHRRNVDCGVHVRLVIYQIMMVSARADLHQRLLAASESAVPTCAVNPKYARGARTSAKIRAGAD